MTAVGTSLPLPAAHRDGSSRPQNGRRSVVPEAPPMTLSGHGAAPHSITSPARARIGKSPVDVPCPKILIGRVAGGAGSLARARILGAYLPVKLAPLRRGFFLLWPRTKARSAINGLTGAKSEVDVPNSRSGEKAVGVRRAARIARASILLSCCGSTAVDSETTQICAREFGFGR